MSDGTKNSEKISVTIDADVLAETRRLAETRYGGNLSKAVNQALRTELELGKGPFSKLFEFQGEIRSVLIGSKLKAEHQENAVDWVIPELRLGLELKSRFSSGKPETSAIAAMAYTVGQDLCDEIWIVVPETMSPPDREQWTRVAKDFHLVPCRVIAAAELQSALKTRMKKLRKGSADFEFADHK